MTKIIVRTHIDTKTYAVIKISKTLGGIKKTEKLLKTPSKDAVDSLVAMLKSHYKIIGRHASLVYETTAYGSGTTVTSVETI